MLAPTRQEVAPPPIAAAPDPSASPPRDDWCSGRVHSLPSSLRAQVSTGRMRSACLGTQVACSCLHCGHATAACHRKRAAAPRRRPPAAAACRRLPRAAASLPPCAPPPPPARASARSTRSRVVAMALIHTDTFFLDNFALRQACGRGVHGHRWRQRSPFSAPDPCRLPAPARAVGRPRLCRHASVGRQARICGAGAGGAQRGGAPAGGRL